MEVFPSIQGEGRYVGEAQVFLRLRGCPLRCRWCDTPGSWKLQPEPRARVVEPDGTARRETPWATPFKAACWIASADPHGSRPVSVTGGEPLMWPGFLAGLREMIAGRRLHLETAGAHPRALERVIDRFDHVSLDLKLPADMDPAVEIESEAALAEPAPQDSDEWARARRACLRLVRGRDACAKLVLAGGHETAAYDDLLEDLARIAPETELFLQLVTPVNGVRSPEPERVEAVLASALERGLKVRVLPQVHRIMGRP